MSNIINVWEHNGWGDAIDWFDYERRQLYGHLMQKPKVGDEIRAKMQSGRIGRFEVIEANYPGNPADMFFCKVKDIGYVEGTNKEDVCQQEAV